eukprot:9405069-Pyramimonas_sp.AAC.1
MRPALEATPTAFPSVHAHSDEAIEDPDSPIRGQAGSQGREMGFSVGRGAQCGRPFPGAHWPTVRPTQNRTI